MSRIIQEKEKMGRNAFYVWSVSKLAEESYYKEREMYEEALNAFIGGIIK